MQLRACRFLGIISNSSKGAQMKVQITLFMATKCKMTMSATSTKKYNYMGGGGGELCPLTKQVQEGKFSEHNFFQIKEKTEQ